MVWSTLVLPMAERSAAKQTVKIPQRGDSLSLHNVPFNAAAQPQLRWIPR